MLSTLRGGEVWDRTPSRPVSGSTGSSSRGGGSERRASALSKGPLPRWTKEFPIVNLIGPMAADVRDIMVQGFPGLARRSGGYARRMNSRSMKLVDTKCPQPLRPNCFASW